MNQKTVVLALFALTILSLGASAACSGRTLEARLSAPDAWFYCQDIAIYNNDTAYGMEANQTVLLSFPHAALVTAGKSWANASDVFFTHSGTEIDAINLTAWNSGTTLVALKVNSSILRSASDTINFSVYYGGDGWVVSDRYRNATKAFWWADDFTRSAFGAGVLNQTGYWAQNAATYTATQIEKGTVTFTTSGGWWNVLAQDRWSIASGVPQQNTSLITRIRNETGFAASAIQYIGGRCGTNNTVNCGGSAESSWFFDATAASVVRLRYGAPTGSVGTAISPVEYKWYLTDFRLTPATSPAQFWRSGGNLTTISTNPANLSVTSNGTWVPAIGTDGSGNIVNFTYDFIGLRKYSTAVEPNVQFGTEETKPSSYYEPVYSTFVEELENSTHLLYFNATYGYPDASDINATLYWDGGVYYPSETKAGTGSGNYTFSTAVPIGVVPVNATPASFTWNLTFLFSNGTWGSSNTSTYSQVKSQAFNLTSFNALPSSVVEGNTVTTFSTISNASDGTLYGGNVSIIHTWNSTNTTTTWNGTNYVGLFSAPFVGSTVNVTGNGTLIVSYGTTSRAIGSSDASVRVYLLEISNCSNSTTYLMNFSFYDEETLASINASMYAYFNITTPSGAVSRNYNFSFVNTTNASICVSPVGSYYVNSVQDYHSQYALNYPVRHYYLINASLSTASVQTINLYLLRFINAAGVQPITQITLQDSSGVTLSGYTIQSARFYPDLNQYLLVGMGKTDTSGVASIYLRPNDVYHRFFVYNDTDQVQAFDPQYVVGSPVDSSFYVTLTLNINPLEEYYSKTALIGYSCAQAVVAGNNTISCVYSAPSGAVGTMYLTVNRLAIWNATYQVCQDTSTSAADVLTCDLGDNATNWAQHKLFAYNLNVGHSPTQPLTSGFIDLTGGQINAFNGSDVGIFAEVAIFVTLVGIAFWSPTFSIIMGMLALFIGAGLGFLTLTYGTFIFLSISASLIIWKIKQ